MTRRARVVVCGTTFGQVYLEGVRAAAERFELVGILAQGSARSRACAEHYRVPLYRDVQSLPADVDIACVIVRGGLLGGRGSEIAKRLMSRKIHVLQEQPLHYDEVSECLREARRAGVRWALNSFYRHLPVTRRFVRMAKTLLSTRAASYVEAACSIQVGYPLLDVLQSTLGRSRPWSFATGDAKNSADPLQRVSGTLAGVPLTLAIQNQVHPSDPDDYARLLHRVTLGTEAGELSLLTSHGPIAWLGRPEVPREVREAHATRLYVNAPLEPSSLCSVLWATREGRSQRELFRADWPNAVAHALLEFVDGCASPARQPAEDQARLAVCKAWRDLSGVLGAPALLSASSPPASLSHDELARLVACEAECQPGAS